MGFAFRFKRECSEEEFKEKYWAAGANNEQDSATLYDLLCQHVEGEGLMVLKANQGREGLLSSLEFVVQQVQPSVALQGVATLD